MKKTFAVLAIVATAFLGFPPRAVAETNIAVGAGGIYPPGTSFNGVSINGLQSGYGVNIADSGSGLGQFSTILLGVGALGSPQNIVVYGKATSGSRAGANVATFSGTCTVDPGDGSPPATNTPFTATVTSDGAGGGTIAVTLGATTLPAATLTDGSLTIR